MCNAQLDNTILLPGYHPCTSYERSLTDTPTEKSPSSQTFLGTTLLGLSETGPQSADAWHCHCDFTRPSSVMLSGQGLQRNFLSCKEIFGQWGEPLVWSMSGSKYCCGSDSHSSSLSEACLFLNCFKMPTCDEKEMKSGLIIVTICLTPL